MKRTLLALVTLTVALPCTAPAERQFAPRQSVARQPKLTLDVGALELYFKGRAQLQVAAFVGEDALLSDGLPAEEFGLRLRRTRFGAGASYDGFTIGLEIDLLEGNGTALHEAFLGWENDYFMAYGGIVKTPMSRTALVSSAALQHAERSMTTRALTPPQQLGAFVGGKVWESKVRLMAGVYNGMTRGATFRHGFQRIDPSVGNRFGGVAFAARLDFEPLGLLDEGLADLGHTDEFRLGIGGGVLINRGETDEGMGFSADLALKYMGWSLAAEFVQLTNGPTTEPTQTIATLGEVTMRGLTAQTGYAIMKNRLELAFRFEMVDEAVEVEDSGDYFDLGVTLSAYLFDGRLKMQAFYQHRMERYGNERDNDVFLLQAEGRF